MLTWTSIDSPIGELRIVAKSGVLCAVAFAEDWEGAGALLVARLGNVSFARDPLAAIVSRFRAYFDGELDALDSLEVDAGGTDFQRRVWAALRKVPVGQTCSYHDIARAIGAPGAVRAVGSANGKNPVPIVVPCHRVIRADGSIGGYGGGLARKRWLLAHEGAIPGAGTK